jgi:hypothetical protein
MAGVNVPEALNLERGQLVDSISDWHQYLYGKRVAVVGDPDQVLALTRFLVSLDMQPVHIVTGSPAGKKYEKSLREAVAEVPGEVNIKVPGDMLLFHQWIKNDPVDLIIGNTYAKYIAKDEDIPLCATGSRSTTGWATATSPPWATAGAAPAGETAGCDSGPQGPRCGRHHHGAGDVASIPKRSRARYRRQAQQFHLRIAPIGWRYAGPDSEQNSSFLTTPTRCSMISRNQEQNMASIPILEERQSQIHARARNLSR